MLLVRIYLTRLLLAACLLLASDAHATERPDFDELTSRALIGPDEERQKALDFFVARGKLDMVPTLVWVMRLGGDHVQVAEALEKLTGTRFKTWRDAMLWQEAHPEIVPHASYYERKLRHWRNVDVRLADFFKPEFFKPERMKIRFEEITWGGVRVDGIPSLDQPKMLPANEARFLKPDDLVFGIEINDDVRAYPLRIMNWHEMLNDVIGGVPVALAYCTLCGSGILYETAVEGRKQPFVFGSSGLLYRSNKLMFDRETKSLWNQFTGRPVVGPLADRSIQLKIRPVAITSWENWERRHPSTQVLSPNTGYIRDYGSGVAYREYFASPDLMFPAIVRDEQTVKRKGYVFGIRKFGVARAWPLAVFRTETVINDAIGATNLVLIGNAETRTVRAYERGDRDFAASGRLDRVNGPHGEWAITENYLLGPQGTKLARVPGHVSYWFAWDSYLGISSSLYRK